ncbi:MAG TPA: penicillin-binding protein 1C [Paucimonas sp.]|nr:penicillin-binding protein 1C [Paucimonas sp.]
MSVRNTLLVFGLLLPLPAAAMPSPEQVRAAYRPSEAELLDRHGEPLHSLRIDMTVRRLPWVRLSDVSPALTAAVLQAEDRRFYRHRGADLEAFGKAAWDNLFRKRPRGASTITMQLAALLDRELQPRQGARSLGQKWDQVRAARELEAGWSKEQILEAYLNLVSFRGELQGIGAASQVLHGKAPSGLNDVESVILASLIRAPNAAPALVARRACGLAAERKLAAPCSVIAALAESTLARTASYEVPALAPNAALKLLKRPAERIVSTLDGALQRFASDSLRQQLTALRGRNVNDGAVVVLDNASGEILAYVGNAGDSSVDGAAALRQAGSTLKPFLYQLAIEKRRLTAASVLDDTPIDISTPGGLYIPQNYDREFKGLVSVRASLAASLNVPAVRTLVMLGMETFHHRLRALGLNSLTEPADYYGYSLALGSAEVSLLELTNAYRTLAGGGVWTPVSLLPRAAAERRQVLDARAVFIVSDILSDRAARSATFGLSNELATPYWAAVKTGTSKDMRDNWCIGYSARYTVGVWVGNFDGQPMWDVSGVTGAAPVWRDIMDFLHRTQPSPAPAAPRGVVARQIDYVPRIEAARREWFLAGTESTRIELVPEALRAPKIRYPGEGVVIAIDPDIPEPNQRLFFQAQGARDLVWRLDGVVLGDAGSDHAWRPVPGEHRLELLDRDGKTIDAVGFQVRGAAQD